MAESFRHLAEKKLRANNIHAPVTQLQDLPLHFPDAHFDVVLCYETIEHVPNPHAFIAELSRTLKLGGTLVLTTPNRLWEPIHWLSAKLKLDHGEGPHRMLPRTELVQLFTSNGFAVRTEKTFVLIPAGPRWLLRIGKWIESVLPECARRICALRRTFVCTKS
jgi:2-polyprenyl-3-methyl-5-hydroxy-6-metoxy-1,4-benzoquinol methylase